MAKPSSHLIVMRVSRLEARTDYSQFTAEFQPDNVYGERELPAEFVARLSDGGFPVLTPAGVAELVRIQADNLDGMRDERNVRKARSR